MTAVNLIVQPRARVGYILTDTAVTNPDGTVQRFAGKVLHSVKGFPWAIGLSGNVAPEVLLQAIGETNALTLKQLTKRLAGALRRAVRETAEAQRIGEVEVFCHLRGAAWDFARKRPQGFSMQSAASAMAMAEGGWMTVEPYVWYDCDSMLGTHEAAGVLLGRGCDLSDPKQFDPEVDGLKLVTEQRRRPVINLTPGLIDGYCRIGGEIHLTEVRKSGVQVFSLGAFADAIGAHIHPDATFQEPGMATA